MFESAEVGHVIDKTTYDQAVPGLRADLLDAQFDVLDKRAFSVVVLINGIDAAGKGETVNLLNEWMDPRHIEAWAFDMPGSDELARPPMWRFWRALPAKGKIGLLFGNWYHEPLHALVDGRMDEAGIEQRIGQINRFERMLTNEGVLLIKLWFHLGKKQQKSRLAALEDDPKTRWRVTKRDWAFYKLYDAYRDAAEHVLRRTSTGEAPWFVVDGSDARYRAMFVGQTLLTALRRRLTVEAQHFKTRNEAPALQQALDGRNYLNTLKLDQALGKKAYSELLEVLQGRLALLTREKAFKDRSVVLVFEGNDAAGKGGAIRRVTAAMDIRQYRVIPIGAPTDEELAHPYLWRFWRQVPRRGRVAIFDRSWYGRVLVERVEGFCSEADWSRAYSEINDFEDNLVSAGAVVIKFWLAVSNEEQLRRFQGRELQPHKRFKITAEDWRNREKWNDYEQAVCDMIDRTSTEIAPWTVVEADNKRYARIKILQKICERLETALGR